MKKIIAALMMFMGIGNLLAYNADDTNGRSIPEKIYKSFTCIGVSELPSNISEILYFEFKDYIVKSVEVKTVSGKNIYMITLLDAENFEYCIYIDEEGTILE